MLHRSLTSRLAIIATLLAIALGAHAEKSAWLVTFAPGTEVYELEGHTALRIVPDSAARAVERDVVINWGVFDFAAPGFVWRFALGQTDYMVGCAPTQPFYDAYLSTGRSITEQRLNLSPEQIDRLETSIIEALKPENRVYRYKYAHDNCATRPLAYVEGAIGDSITIAPAAAGAAPTTLRREMSRFHSAHPWYQLGIDIALGADIDRDIDRRTEGFAPVTMAEIAASATIPDGNGGMKPLVAETNVITPHTAQEPFVDDLPSPLTVAWAVLAIVAVTLAVALCRRSLPRWLYIICFTLQGLGGLLVAFLVFFSQHYATSPNYVLLWLNPLALIVAPALFSVVGRKILTYYHVINIVLLLALAAVFIAGVQVANTAFYPLMAASFLLSAYYLWYQRDKIIPAKRARQR